MTRLGRFALLLLAIVAQISSAQEPATSGPTGRIVGRIIDAATGQGIPQVTIQVVGTRFGTISGVDGRFNIVRVPAGTVTLHVRMIGYTPKTVTGIMLTADKTVEQNVTLDASAAMLTATVVTATAQRGSTAEALNTQKTAIGIVSAVTVEQISKSPDSDAAQAVQRVSGVTVQKGGNLFVRGLGERYTTTQLNGTRVPSPEPEKRTVPLDLFPSGLLETITTSKTFTPDQQGDFSGAQVEIKTREFPAIRQYSLAMTVGYNAGATGNDVLSAFTAGGERVGNVGAKRNLPSVIRSFGNLQGINLNQADENFLIGQFRNAWTPTAATALPNNSMSFSVGGNDPVVGQRIGYLLSATFSQSTDLRSGQVRALANRGNEPGSTVEQDRFEGESGTTGVMWGGLANFSTLRRRPLAPDVQQHVQPHRRQRRTSRIRLVRERGLQGAHRPSAIRRTVGSLNAGRRRAPVRRGASHRLGTHVERRHSRRARSHGVRVRHRARAEWRRRAPLAQQLQRRCGAHVLGADRG